MNAGPDRKLLLEAGLVLTGEGADEVVAGGAVLVQGETIRAVGPASELRAQFPDAERLGGDDFVLLPSLSNAHDHGRGFNPATFGIPDGALELWVLGLERPAPGTEYLRTLWTGMQMIRSGVTTLNQCLPTGGIDRLAATADEVLRAYVTLGLRGGLVLQVKDSNFVAVDDDALLASLPADERQRAQAFLDAQPVVPMPEFLALFERVRAQAATIAPRVRVLLGPGAPWRASDDVLGALAGYAAQSGAGVHMHLLESRHQRDYGLGSYGESMVAHLDRLGFLGPHLAVAHLVWPSAGDLELLAERGVAVSHNLSSNLRLRSGVAPLREMLRAGLRVGLGLDGLSTDGDEDLWSEMRLVRRVHAAPGLDGWAPAPQQVLRMATAHGAAVTLGAGPGIPGSLRAEQPADLMLVRREGAHIVPTGDAPLRPAGVVGQLLSVTRAAQVDTVLVGGQLVLRGGRFTLVDEDAIREEVHAALREYRPGSALADLLAPLRASLVSYYTARVSPGSGPARHEPVFVLEPGGAASTGEAVTTAPLYRLMGPAGGKARALYEFGPGGDAFRGRLVAGVDDQTRSSAIPPGCCWGTIVLGDGRRVAGWLAAPDLAEHDWLDLTHSEAQAHERAG